MSEIGNGCPTRRPFLNEWLHNRDLRQNEVYIDTRLLHDCPCLTQAQVSSVLGVFHAYIPKRYDSVQRG